MMYMNYHIPISVYTHEQYISHPFTSYKRAAFLSYSFKVGIRNALGFPLKINRNLTLDYFILVS